uniref:GEVED domain-containing protein n=1 Tax=Flavobacterium sp. TaxID=239 RepID=UPI004049AD66
MGKICAKSINVKFNIDEKKISNNKYDFLSKDNSTAIYKILIFTVSFFVMGLGSIWGQCGPFEIYESFGTQALPTQGGTWQGTSMTYTTTNISRTGLYGLTFNAAGDAIRTPQIASPGVLSFWYRRSNNSTAWTLYIQTSPDGTTWTNRGTITNATTTYQQYTLDIGTLGLTNVFIRLLDARGSGSHARYVDDLSITSTVASNNTILIQGQSCTPTLTAGVTYTIYDSGGVNDQYSINQTTAPMTLIPPAGYSASVNLTTLATEASYDYLKLYDGTTTTSTPFHSGSGWSGSTAPGSFSASNATFSLTIDFTSDVSTNGNGFVGTLTFDLLTSCSALPSSLNSSVTSTTTAILSWTDSSPEPTSGYQYYYSTSATAPTAGTIATGSTAASVTSANLTGLTANTTYYFWVRSNCGSTDGTSSWAGSGSFYTGYCIPTGNSSYYITNVTTTNGVSNITNTTTTNSGYGNFTGQSASNFIGATTNFSLTHSATYGAGVSVFIDWNNDLDFDDANEKVLGTTAYNNSPFTGTITTPTGTSNGDYRMRVVLDYWSTTPIACPSGISGETEDYTFTVVTAPSCLAPSALTSSILTSSTAAISWTAPTNAPANGYEYYVATSSTAPTAGSVATGSTNAGITTANLSGLTANTTYYFWVRSNCGGDGVSSWVSGGSFIILEGNNCDLIQDLATLNSPYSGTTVGYSNSFTNSCLTGTGGDRIFKIDVPNGSQLFIGQSSNGYDSKHRIAYGGTCPGTTEINTGYVANFPTQLTNGTVSGCIDDDDLTHYFFNNNTGSTQTVYWIQDGFSTGEGTFTLEWELIQPSDPITITPSSATSFCSGNSVDLTASSSASYSYSWSPATGLNTTTGATVTANPSTTTTYTVTGDNGAGMTNTQTITITITPSPTDVIIGNVSETICRNSVQTLSASGGDFINVSILTEDFNGAATGWTTINNSTGGTPANAAWMFYLSGTSFYSNDNTDFVMTDSDAQGAGTTDTSLTSPVFSLEGLTTASLSFYHYFNYLDSNDSATVQISTNGLTWTNLEFYTSDQGSATNFALKTISLDAYVGNPSVQIRFQYNASWAWYWAIDNFSVTGSGQNIIWSPTTDLYTDSSCTTAYNSENLATVYAKPTANRTYTATSTLGSCEKTDEITFTVESATYDGTSWSSAPAPNKEIVFNGNHTLKLVNEISSNGGSITFENNSSLIQINNVTNSGNIIYKRVSPQTVINTDYVYWSSPVSGQTVSNGYNYVWNNAAGTTGTWTSAVGQSMTAGKGVIMRGIGSRTFTGVPYNGEINVTVYRRNLAGFNDNWNLIGNPYPSAISADEFLTDLDNANIDGSIAIWTHNSPISSSNNNPFYGNYTYNYNPNDYIIYNLTGSQNGPESYHGYIPAGQAFFVKYDDDDNASPIAASSLIKFKNSMRIDADGNSYSNSQFYRNSETSNQILEKNRIWIDIVGGSAAFSRTMVGYIETATANKDRLFDTTTSVKPANTSIYSLINTDKMSIQAKGLPFSDSDVIPLGFNAAQAGSFTIAIYALDGLFVNQDVYLFDAQLNITHNIKLTPYSFTATQGENNSRFQLIFNETTLSNPDFDLENAVTLINRDQLKVISAIENIEEIKVFDLLGRTIYVKNNIDNKEFEIPITQEQAPIIVKIKLANGIYLERKTLY